MQENLILMQKKIESSTLSDYLFINKTPFLFDRYVYIWNQIKVKEKFQPPAFSSPFRTF